MSDKQRTNKRKALPETIVVGPLIYIVEEVSDLYHKGQPIFGYYNPAGGRIQIEADISETRKLITLWHEMLHAILNHAQRGDTSEEVVGTLAVGIVDLLKDNPALRESRD